MWLSWDLIPKTLQKCDRFNNMEKTHKSKSFQNLRKKFGVKNVTKLFETKLNFLSFSKLKIDSGRCVRHSRQHLAAFIRLQHTRWNQCRSFYYKDISLELQSVHRNRHGQVFILYSVHISCVCESQCCIIYCQLFTFICCERPKIHRKEGRDSSFKKCILI